MVLMGSIGLSLSEAVLQAIADALIHRLPHADAHEARHIRAALGAISAALHQTDDEGFLPDP
jgi:hypothetical protein